MCRRVVGWVAAVVFSSFWLVELLTSQKMGDQRWRQQDASEISQRMRIYICRRAQRLFHSISDGPAKKKKKQAEMHVCVCVCTFCAHAQMDFQHLISLLLLSALRESTYGNLGRKGNMRNFHKGPQYQNYAFVSDGNRCMWTNNPARSSRAQTYNSRRAPTRAHMIAECERDYNISPPQPD